MHPLVLLQLQVIFGFPPQLCYCYAALTAFSMAAAELFWSSSSLLALALRLASTLLPMLLVHRALLGLAACHAIGLATAAPERNWTCT